MASLALGDLEAARRDLERYASGLPPGLAEVDVALGDALRRVDSSTPQGAAARAGHLAEEARLALAAGALERARALCDEALALSPDHPRALAMRGLATPGPEGLADLDRSIDLAPEGWLFDQRSSRRFAAGDAAGARADLARAIALDGPSSARLYRRAHVLSRLGQRAAALADAEEAVRIGPDDGDAWVMLATIARLDPARLDVAARAARRATELKPESGPAWAELGTILHELGRFAESIPALSRALELARPETVPLLLCARGRSHLVTRQAVRALRDLERCVALDPTYEQAWTWLADARLTAGQHEGAAAAADRALERAPDDIVALRARGVSRFRLDDRAGARADLERLRELRPALFAQDPLLVDLLRRLEAPR